MSARLSPDRLHAREPEARAPSSRTRMRSAILLLSLAALLPTLASAGPLPPPMDATVCTLYLDIIDPNPPVLCVRVDYDAINDVCIYSPKLNKCIQYVGPAL